MALELRICNGLATTPFFSILGEYAKGNVTRTNIIDNINNSFGLGNELTTDETTNVDQHISELDALETLGEKHTYLLELYNIFNLAEYSGYTLYQDRATVKTRLGYTV